MNNLKFAARRHPMAHAVLHAIRYLLQADYRCRHRSLLQQLAAWRNSTERVMEAPLGDGSRGVAVVFGWGTFEHVLAESVVRKALELADFGVHVLTDPTPGARAVYAAMGAPHIEPFLRYCPLPDRRQAAALLAGVNSFEDLIGLQVNGVAVGKYVSSTLMRRSRKGYLDLSDETVREDLEAGLATSLAYVRGAQQMIETLRPQAVVMVDRGYSPFGEVFDMCINQQIPVVTWNVAHRDNTLMLKRYHRGNADAHPSSLSAASWQKLLGMEWGAHQRQQLVKELAESYNSGEWYSEVGTQFGKRAWQRNEIIERLGLDPAKKTAVLFAHIFWDATFFWGEDLFRDYEEWFVQTVRTACANDRLNWLIKVHPANLVKDQRDGVKTEPSEVVALRERIGPLPRHVKVIPADADITTLSLFDAMDYCLTVRGTVGIEAALHGKLVLTAGTGRYDRHGFTVDSETKEDYLALLERLEELSPASAEMRERAERFGYGVFLCRPVRLGVFDLRFRQDATATLVASCGARSVEEMRAAPELRHIAEWLNGDEEDLLGIPE